MGEVSRFKVLLMTVTLSLASSRVLAADFEREISFSIPSQALSSALMLFAEQSSVQVITSSEDLGAYESPGVEGKRSVREALTAILEGTGLKFREVGEGTVTVWREGERTAAALDAMRVAQVEGGVSPSTGEGDQAASSENTATAATGKKEDEEEVAGAGIPEILVTGSKLGTLNMDIRRSENGVQPYVVFDRDAIERSGARDIENFIKISLPMSTSPASNIQSADNQFGNTTQINLRGLGYNQTLILVDGRRTAGFATSSGVPLQPDLNGIPLSAVERIEVLPTTASGIYGGSATGGVINVVLRRDYAGLETALTYEDTFRGGGAGHRIDFNAGVNIEDGRTNILIAGAYSDADGLLTGDRDFVEQGREHIMANNPGTFFGATTPPLGATTNIRSATGENLTLRDGTPLNSPFTHVPQGYLGVGSDGGAALVASAGKYNLSLANTAQASGGGLRSMLNRPTLESLTVTTRRQFSLGLQAFIEMAASNNSTYATMNGASSTFVIPTGAPSNPFNQRIRVTTPAVGMDGEGVSRLHNRKITGGVIAKLPKNWQAEADHTWNRTHFTYSQPGGFISAGQVTTDVGSGALDIFRDTNLYPPGFSAYKGIGNSRPPMYTTLQDSAMRLAGPLWVLPGGAQTLAILLEHRKESLGDVYQIFPSSTVFTPSRSQTVDSIYLETGVPIVSDRNTIPGVRLLEIQLAARRDRYTATVANTVNSSTPEPVVRTTNRLSSIDPTIGARYKPVSDLMIRGSYGTGFLPPAVNQLLSTESLVSAADLALLAEFLGITDPRRGNEPVGGGADVAVSGGGNAALRPEQSESWSAGIVFTPRFVPGLRVSLDWTTIDKSENIEAPFGLIATTFDYEPTVPDLVLRAPPQSDGFDVGPVIALQGGLVNIAAARVESYDFSLDYTFDSAKFGTLSFSTIATRQMHRKTQTLPNDIPIENVGLIGDLKLRANSSFTWKYGPWGFAWNTVYYSSYQLNPNFPGIVATQGSATVPSQTYHDLFSSYRFGDQIDSGPLSKTEIHVGIKNVFNAKPPFDASATHTGIYYSVLGDPRLTTYYLSLRKSF